MNFSYEVHKSDLKIYLVNNGKHKQWYNRLKVWLWNFILPPHIRLKIEDEAK